MSTNVKLEIWWILPSKQIGVRLKARVMVDKRDAFGLNWEVSTQISKWYHILLILVRRQNANIVQFTQMQQMLNDWEGLWYWLSELWYSKRVLNLESKSHASLLVKMHSKRFRSRFWCKLPHFRFPQAGKNQLLKRQFWLSGPLCSMHVDSLTIYLKYLSPKYHVKKYETHHGGRKPFFGVWQ